MTRVLTVLLGDNQTFDSAEAVLVKHGGTRIESPEAVMNNQSIECAIPIGEWYDCRVELQYLRYDIV